MPRIHFIVIVALVFAIFARVSPAEPAAAAFSVGAYVETRNSTEENPEFETWGDDNDGDFEARGFIHGLSASVETFDTQRTPAEDAEILAQAGLTVEDRDQFLNATVLPRPESFLEDEVDFTGVDIVVDVDADDGNAEARIPAEIGSAESYRMFRGSRETELATRAMIKRLDQQLEREGIAKKDYLVTLFVDADTISWEVSQLATILKANGYDFKVIRFKSTEPKKKRKGPLYAAEYYASKIFYSFTDERKISAAAKANLGGYPTLADQELSDQTSFPKWDEFKNTPLSRELAQKAARSIAWNFMLQTRYFFRAHKGFQVSWFKNSRTGIGRPWKEQAVELIAATAIGSFVAAATKMSYQAAALTNPNINVQNAMIASFACEIIFGYFRKAQNALFTNLGMTYDHGSKKMVPYFPCAATTMFGLSMVVSLAPFIAGHRPVDAWHLVSIGLLHLMAKYGPTMALARAQVGSEVTGGGKKTGWWSTAWNTAWAGFTKTLKLLENNEFSGIKNIPFMGQQIPFKWVLDTVYKGLAVHGGWRWLVSRLKGSLERFPESSEETWAHIHKRWRKEKRSMHDKHVWLADLANEWVRSVQRWFGADEMALVEPAAPPVGDGGIADRVRHAAHSIRYPEPNYCARLLVAGRMKTRAEIEDPVGHDIP